MLTMGLSLEDEARQLARRALQDGVKASASIVSTTTTWQRRVASAFADQWQDDGKVANIENWVRPTEKSAKPKSCNGMRACGPNVRACCSPPWAPNRPAMCWPPG
jgi:outer membrane PBP1 activator LpoA protein